MRKAQAGKEDAKADERERMMAEQKRKKEEQLKDNANRPLAEQIDCLDKYQKILEEFKKTGKKFTDP